MPISTLFLVLSGLLWGTRGLIESALGRHALGRAGMITTAMALAGLGLLAGFPGGGLSETAMLAGTGMALLSAAGFAAVTLLGTSPVPGLDELSLNGFGFSLGGLALLPLAALLGGGLGFRPGLPSAGLLAALGIGPTAVAYTLYFRGLREAPASTAALLTLIEPLTAAALAALVLGQRLSATGIAGAVMLLAAVARTVRTDSAQRRSPTLEVRHKHVTNSPERRVGSLKDFRALAGRLPVRLWVSSHAPHPR